MYNCNCQYKYTGSDRSKYPSSQRLWYLYSRVNIDNSFCLSRSDILTHTNYPSMYGSFLLKHSILCKLNIMWTNLNQCYHVNLCNHVNLFYHVNYCYHVNLFYRVNYCYHVNLFHHVNLFYHVNFCYRVNLFYHVNYCYHVNLFYIGYKLLL